MTTEAIKILWPNILKYATDLEAKNSLIDDLIIKNSQLKKKLIQLEAKLIRKRQKIEALQDVDIYYSD